MGRLHSASTQRLAAVTPGPSRAGRVPPVAAAARPGRQEPVLARKAAKTCYEGGSLWRGLLTPVGRAAGKGTTPQGRPSASAGGRLPSPGLRPVPPSTRSSYEVTAAPMTTRSPPDGERATRRPTAWPDQQAAPHRSPRAASAAGPESPISERPWPIPGYSSDYFPIYIGSE